MSPTGAVTAPRPVTPLGILAQRLGDLEGDLDRVPGVPEELRERLRSATALATGLDPYVAACTSPASAALDALARRTAEVDWTGQGAGLEQEMLSGHVEGQLLAALVHATGARRVLEVGMFTGYSALAMAEALPEGGTVVALELDPYAADLARSCFDDSPAGSRISIEVGPALQTLGRLEGSFDLVFIDADKAGYAGYLDALLDSDLLAPGALIAVDNTLMQGEPWLEAPASVNGRAIADFNAALTYDPRVVQVLLPVRDGVTLVRRA